MKRKACRALLAIRLFAGAVFVLAGSLKLQDPTATVAVHRLISNANAGLGEVLAPTLSLLGPFEILLGVLLMFGLLTRTQSVIAMLGVGASILAHAVASSKGAPYRPCHCFGADFLTSSSYGGALFKNVVMMLLLLPNGMVKPAGHSVDSYLVRHEGALNWRQAFVVVTPILVGVLCVHFLTTGGSSLGGLDSPGKIVIEGDVTMVEGEPVPGCVLLGPQGDVVAVTDPDGRFEIPDARAITTLVAVPPANRPDLKEAEFELPHVDVHQNATLRHKLTILLPQKHVTR